MMFSHLDLTTCFDGKVGAITSEGQFWIDLKSNNLETNTFQCNKSVI